jgi:hypothetical protein
MHCPKCGQQQISDQTRFCSRCGFLLTGIAHVVANDGILPMQTPQSFFAAGSARRRGVMQGVFIFLLSFLIVPLAGVLTAFLNIEPFLPAISAILLIMGGLLRMVYALMFESGVSGGNTLEQNVMAGSQNVFAGKREAGELPPAQSIPTSVYAPPPGTGRWRETNELETPGSVTDSTTKLLHNEHDQ